MSPYRDDCACGHDRTHHHKHTDGERYNCLAMHCNCQRFRDPNEDTKDPEFEAAPDTDPSWLDDFDCGDPPPSTPRMAWGTNKPHASTGCTCAACQAWVRKKVIGYTLIQITIGAGGTGGGAP